MKRSDASKLAREHMDKHGLEDMRVVINPRLTSTFGRFRRTRFPADAWIELSGKLVDINDEKRVLRTILHEIAHALTVGHGHDKVWKRKCLEIGGDGIARYSSADTNTVARPTRDRKVYTLQCQKCDYSGGRYYRRMNNYRHKRCLGDLVSVEI